MQEEIHMYDLRHLGATLPQSIIAREELRPGFATDSSAPKYQGDASMVCDRI
jgi:hypothetical protein